jgi:hypothetical protein
VRAEDERAEQLVLDEVGSRMRTAQLAAVTAPSEASVDATDPVLS